MQEKQVSVGGASRELPQPFFVLATQNPIEMEGTYPLPEAQLDRFLLNVFIDYLPEEEEVRVVSETTRRDDVQPSPVFSAEEVLRIQGVVRKVPVADSVVRYAVRLAASSRPGQAGAPDFVNEWVNWGAGLRAGQALILGGKARRCCRAAPMSRRTTSRRSPCRCCATASCPTSRPRPRALTPTRLSRNSSRPFPSREPSRHNAPLPGPEGPDGNQEPFAPGACRGRGLHERAAPQSAHRVFHRVHRVPPILARRRRPLPRLEGDGANRPRVHQEIRGRD
ncbi:MAG: hypothetical protein CM1200mP34_2580 [Verrucomicrobiales bacterium]|nr:MAG: hypothetical protein CM1200mP34_2580 [Verrucomicrobiales bacterium]